MNENHAVQALAFVGIVAWVALVCRSSRSKPDPSFGPRDEVADAYKIIARTEQERAKRR